MADLTFNECVSQCSIPPTGPAKNASLPSGRLCPRAQRRSDETGSTRSPSHPGTPRNSADGSPTPWR